MSHFGTLPLRNLHRALRLLLLLRVSGSLLRDLRIYPAGHLQRALPDGPASSVQKRYSLEPAYQAVINPRVSHTYLSDIAHYDAPTVHLHLDWLLITEQTPTATCDYEFINFIVSQQVA
jgi:hypothetical protein